MRILISAGEASGDLYASRLVEALRERAAQPDSPLYSQRNSLEFFGCAGPRMQSAGVRAVVDANALGVVGIVEVVSHIPRIYREFRKLVKAAETEKPDFAILTDSPDFHLRLATKLRERGIPVVYLIAPQAWAWRQGRVRRMRRDLAHLLCIFPFEQEFFEKRGIPTTFIGHPLARIVKPTLSEGDFRVVTELKHGERPVVLLPGSRHGEVARHMPYLLDTVRKIRETAADGPNLRFVLALPGGFGFDGTRFSEPVRASSIQVVEGYTWDCLSNAKMALAASGTVTVEAALLGAPMVTFYRVNALSWILGRWMVNAPFLSMVNLVAGKEIVPELIQEAMTADRLASEAVRLLEDSTARERVRAELERVAALLKSEHDPMDQAARVIERNWNEKFAHAV